MPFYIATEVSLQEKKTCVLINKNVFLKTAERLRQKIFIITLFVKEMFMFTFPELPSMSLFYSIP